LVPSWTTTLSATSADNISLRGYDLTSLVGTVPFSSVLYLLYSGELPDPAAARLIDAVMVASVDHGAGPPSVLAARTAISGGASLPAAAAAGMLTFGDFHGAAVDDAMETIASVLERAGDGDEAELAAAADEIVASRRAAGRRLSGFGHRQHRVTDPRIGRLFSIAGEVGVEGRHLAAASAIEAALGRALDRPLPMNIDGAVAAILGEVGFPRHLGNAVFIASRIVGVMAHANEERQTMTPMRTIDPVDHVYAGPPARSLPRDDHATSGPLEVQP
jgi:citrate synthase